MAAYPFRDFDQFPWGPEAQLGCLLRFLCAVNAWILPASVLNLSLHGSLGKELLTSSPGSSQTSYVTC